MNTDNFTFLCRSRSLFGKNALEHLPFELSGMGARKVFVLRDNASESSDSIRHLRPAFADSGMTLGLCPPPDQNSGTGTDILKDCYRTFTGKGYDSIIALGTGPITDLAKALNLAVSLGPEVFKRGIQPQDQAKSLLPFAYLPTRGGSGRESSCRACCNAQIFELPALAPDIVLTDERLMAADTKENIICSAFSALSVCCETFVFADNPMAKAYASAGISLLMEHLFPLLETENEWNARPAAVGNKYRRNLACIAHASAISGFLLANSTSIISFHLGNFIAENADTSGLTAGSAAAIFLPRVLEQFAGNTPALAQLLLPLGGQDAFSAVPPVQQAAAAIHILQNILNRFYQISFGAVPRSLGDAGIDKSAVARLQEKIQQEDIWTETGISGAGRDKIAAVLLRS